MVGDAFRETDGRLASMSASGRCVITSAFRAGRAAGDRVKLSNRRSTEATRLTRLRDRQRQRVYASEERIVTPCDPTTLPFPATWAMVDAIWSDMGLRYPPEVVPLPCQAARTVGRADRLLVALAEKTPSWCLLHELAHAMIIRADGRTDGHGPIFMGIYVWLLERYLRLDVQFLSASLREAGIEFVRDMLPVFVDP